MELGDLLGDWIFDLTLKTLSDWFENYFSVDVTDRCQIKALTGEESNFEQDFEDGLENCVARSLGIVSPDKISLMLKVWDCETWHNNWEREQSLSLLEEKLIFYVEYTILYYVEAFVIRFSFIFRILARIICLRILIFLQTPELCSTVTGQRRSWRSSPGSDLIS